MARKGKTLKEVILELLQKPMTLEDLLAAVKKKKPKARPRVVKALVTRLKKEGVIKESAGKLSAA